MVQASPSEAWAGRSMLKKAATRQRNAQGRLTCDESRAAGSPGPADCWYRLSRWRFSHPRWGNLHAPIRTWCSTSRLMKAAGSTGFKRGSTIGRQRTGDAPQMLGLVSRWSCTACFAARVLASSWLGHAREQRAMRTPIRGKCSLRGRRFRGQGHVSSPTSRNLTPRPRRSPPQMSIAGTTP